MPEEVYEMKVIARCRSDFESKFGVPRQSGLAPSLRSKLVFEAPFGAPEAFRGIEQYSHLWLLWGFSQNVSAGWSPTVRPPKLGGNERLGVYATRSPFRPNPIGLSCVRLEEVKEEPQNGTVLIVSGADLADGTPIFDVKPYLPYADGILTARGGFAEEHSSDRLAVDIPPKLLSLLPPEKRAALTEALSLDPRPSYQTDESRVYGFGFAGFEIKFTVSEDTVNVVEIQ